MATTKVSLDRAEALAKALGYTGQKNNKDIKAFLEGYGDPVEDASGNPIDLKALEIEVPAPKRVSLGEEKSKSDDDAEARLNATIDNLTKQMAALNAEYRKNGGNGRAPVASVTGGMTADQKRYERLIKEGKAAYDSVEEAEFVADYLCGEQFSRLPNFAAAPVVQAGKKSWEDRVATKRFAGVEAKDLTMAPNSGAVLASHIFSDQILRLVDTYGVGPQNCDVIDGIEAGYTDFKTDPSAMVLRYPGSTPSGTAIASQEPTYTAVNLYPKQALIQHVMNREVLASSRLNMVQSVTEDLAWAAAKGIDDTIFLGDGSATYGGIFGITGRFTVQGGQALSTSASAVNTDFAGGNSAGDWSGYVIDHFHRAMSKLRSYAYQLRGGQVAWWCSRAAFNAVMVRIAMASTRATATELFAGPVPMFLGLPVIFTECMNRNASTGTTTIDFLLGNLRTSVKYGRGRGPGGGPSLELAMSEHSDFSTNAIRLRGALRHDVNVHDAGNPTSTIGATGSLIAIYQV